MRLLVTGELAARRLDELRAAAPGIEVASLRLERARPTWARALRFASRRWLPYAAYASIAPALERSGRLSLQLDGAPVAEARGVEVLLASWALGGPAARRAIDALPDLRWIHSTATGFDRFDLAQLRQRGIRLTATRGIHSRRIAEFVLGLVYSEVKRIDEHWQNARRGRPRCLQSRTLRGLTLGIVGYGSIGREVARLGVANGLRVVALVREEGRAPPLAGVETTTDLHRVLAASEVVVLALPLTGATRGLLDRRAFAAMRRGAVLVNVGRAATVVEGELLRALGDGTLARAYLDLVHDEDDVPPNHPTQRQPNVLYTAHSAAASLDAGDEVFAGFVANLRLYCEGRPLQDLVEPDERVDGGAGAR